MIIMKKPMKKRPMKKNKRTYAGGLKLNRIVCNG